MSAALPPLFGQLVRLVRLSACSSAREGALTRIVRLQHESAGSSGRHLADGHAVADLVDAGVEVIDPGEDVLDAIEKLGVGDGPARR